MTPLKKHILDSIDVELKYIETKIKEFIEQFKVRTISEYDRVEHSTLLNVQMNLTKWHRELCVIENDEGLKTKINSLMSVLVENLLDQANFSFSNIEKLAVFNLADKYMFNFFLKILKSNKTRFCLDVVDNVIPNHINNLKI